MLRLPRLGPTCLALLVLGCSPETPSEDRVPPDAGAESGAPFDGGSSSLDARAQDAHEPPDDAGVAAPDAAGGAKDSQAVDADPTTPDAEPDPVDTGALQSDAGVPAGDAGQALDGGTATDSGVVGPQVLSPGWIGGPCQSPAECTYADSVCLTEAEGWPRGTCSLPCSRTCPDLAGPLHPVTFCVEDGDGDAQGACVSRCDFTLSPTGCRAGYVCVPDKRMGEPSTVRNVCVPEGGFPGRPEPTFDIGEPCTSAASCSRSSCLTGLPGGYCTQEACDVLGCPSGSRCFNLGGPQEPFFACLKSCSAHSECRSGEGYVCDIDQTCWAAPAAAPTCVLAGGTNDCAPYAAQATADFVVVTKHDRRLTLCHGASSRGSHCVGLGTSPVGDKERQGDRRTPEGIFYIPRRLPNSQYYKAFLISYPDSADAVRGYAAGLITATERDAILEAQRSRTEPPQNTELGGMIEIHGNGAGADWTWGCVAVDDSTIDVLWPVLDVGETVVILP